MLLRGKRMRLWPVMLMGLCLSFLSAAQGLPEQPNDIGYPSPEAALSALSSKPGVAVSRKEGWIILEDKREAVLWTIAKPGNPAYPTAIKRYVAHRKLVTKVLCNASKQACDNVVRQFQALNRQVIDSAQ